MGASLVQVRLEPALSEARRPANRDWLYVSGPHLVGALALMDRFAPECVPPPNGTSREIDDEHLAVGPGESGRPWWPVADVIVADATPPDGCPGCLVMGVTQPGGAGIVWTATGWRALFLPLPAGAGGRLLPCASLVHAWLVAGRPLAALVGATVVAEGGGGFRIVADDYVVSGSVSRRRTVSVWGAPRSA